MIAVLLALQTISAAPSSITYPDVPVEVTRISIFDPRSQGIPRLIDSFADRGGGDLVIRGLPHRTVIVSLVRDDGRYLLDGPFAWPAADATRALDRRWRRTIAAPAGAPAANIASLDWVDVAAPARSSWPICYVDVASRCWGVADGQRGVAVGRLANGLLWVVVSDAGDGVWRESQWGRLVIVRDRQEGRETPQIRFGRPAPSSSGRAAGVRLETRAVEGAVSVPVEGAGVWVAGSEVPPDSWVELKTSRAGPAFVSLAELASGPSSLPLAILLADRWDLAGTVVGARNDRAAGALLTMFRLLDPASADPNRKPRRVFAAEAVADAAGMFQIEGLGDAEYEIVAFHPQLGRAAAVVREGRGGLTIRLKAAGLISGRVMSDGKPVAGVEVTSVPDPEAFRNADDPIDVKGGDARSGPDGHFTVTAAASGGGELRVGGGRLPIKRIPLPRIPLPLVDLGDIDLGAPIDLTIVLDQDTPCGVRATGPVGRSGLQIVTAARIGPGLFQIALPEAGAWNFGLLCGREGRALSPAVLPIGREHAGKEVRLAIR